MNTDLQEGFNAAYSAEIAAARKQLKSHPDMRFDVDAVPKIYVGSGGVWVAAWVWIETQQQEQEA